MRLTGDIVLLAENEFVFIFNVFLFLANPKQVCRILVYYFNDLFFKTQCYLIVAERMSCLNGIVNLVNPFSRFRIPVLWDFIDSKFSFV